jgi:hypothetical protein
VSKLLSDWAAGRAGSKASTCVKEVGAPQVLAALPAAKDEDPALHGAGCMAGHRRQRILMTSRRQRHQPPGILHCSMQHKA